MKGDHQDISTGVDKLVEIVNEKGKIEVFQVAKMLGISQKVIEEWAHFLETKDIIQIKYFLTKTYLMKKEMSKEEIAKKQRELMNKKEAIIRKAENFIENMEKKCDVLEDLRKDYNVFKKDIEDGLNNIKIDFNNIEKHHSVKRDLQKGIFEEQSMIKRKIDDITEQAKSRFKEFQDLYEEVKKEETEIKEYEVISDRILEKEEKMYDQLDALEKSIKVLKQELVDQSKVAGQKSNAMVILEKRVKNLREFFDQRQREFPDILKKLQKNEMEIMQKYEEIDKKISDSRQSSKLNIDEIAEKFKQGRNKIFKIDAEITKIFSEYNIIADELSKVVAEAKSINIIKEGKISKQIEPLNQKLEELNEKKQFFEKHLSNLRLLLKE